MCCSALSVHHLQLQVFERAIRSAEQHLAHSLRSIMGGDTKEVRFESFKLGSAAHKCCLRCFTRYLNHWVSKGCTFPSSVRMSPALRVKAWHRV